jgi:hypothetical protein
MEAWWPAGEERMKVDGSCFCGHLTFEAEVDPETVILCHCTDCQTLSSSAFRIVVPAIEGSFRLLSGRPTIFVKTADSGNRRNLAFCGTCGTAIYSGPADVNSNYLGLRVGALRQRRELIPHAQFWRRSALSWVDDIGQIGFDDAT